MWRPLQVNRRKRQLPRCDCKQGKQQGTVRANPPQCPHPARAWRVEFSASADQQQCGGQRCSRGEWKEGFAINKLRVTEEVRHEKDAPAGTSNEIVRAIRTRKCQTVRINVNTAGKVAPFRPSRRPFTPPQPSRNANKSKSIKSKAIEKQRVKNRKKRALKKRKEKKKHL